MTLLTSRTKSVGAHQPVTVPDDATRGLAELARRDGGPSVTQMWLAAWAALAHRRHGWSEVRLVPHGALDAAAAACLEPEHQVLSDLAHRVDPIAGTSVCAVPGDGLRPDEASDRSPEGADGIALIVLDDAPTLVLDGNVSGIGAVEALSAQLVALVTSGLAHPDRPISRLSLASELEQQELRRRAVGRSVPLPSHRRIDEAVEAVARHSPSLAAVEHEGQVKSYGRLWSEVESLAATLVRGGLRPGSRVGVLLARSPESVTAFLATLRAGGTVVPLDPSQPAAYLTSTLDDAGVVALLSTDSLAAGLATRHQRLLCPVDGPTPADLDLSQDCVSADPDVAAIFYTSGSTGEPKGVLVRHEALLNVVAWTSSAYAVGPEDRACWVGSPAFAIATQEWMAPLCLGATLCLPAAATAMDPDRLAAWLVEQQVSLAVLIAPLAERLWRMAWPVDTRLRYMFATGAPVRTRPPCGLPFEPVVFYACTEALVATSCFDRETGLRATNDQAHTTTPITVGRPVGNVGVHLLDPRGEPVPDGVVGEVCIAGAGLAAGYLGRPEQTAERFMDHELDGSVFVRLYHTGDLARRDRDGLIEMVGRLDLQTKIRGFRVEPEAVELALVALDHVDDAAVLVHDGARGEPELVAHVVSSRHPDLLQAELATRVPHYQVPTRWHTHTVLPRQPQTGKIDRRALRSHRPEGLAGRLGVSSDPDPLIRDIGAIWATVLDQPAMGPDDTFLGLGGHSLAAVDVVSRLRSELGLELSLSDLYEASTVRAVASLVGGDPGTSRPVPAPACVPDPTSRYEPFSLTDTQYAYWIGRGDLVELGGVGCHGYFEWDSDDLDTDRLTRAWARLVARHDALRLVALPDGRQRVLPDPPDYHVAVSDLRDRSLDEAEQTARHLRSSLSHEVFPAERYPLFDVRVTLFPDGRRRLHLSFDLFICDAWSYVQLLLPELILFYEDPELELEPLELGFRDYVVNAERELASSVDHEQSRAYWMARLEDFPQGPALPRAAAGTFDAGNAGFVRRADELDAESWQRLQQAAASRGVTPTCLLVTTFSEVLRTWSENERFALNCPLFNRLPVHPQVNDVVGDFTTTSLLVIEPQSGAFVARCTAVQRQMWADLDHRHFSGVQVVRELARREGVGPRAAFPIVLTSMLGHPPRRSQSALGEAVFGISQTPQVAIDFQVWEVDGRLVYNWDSVESRFPSGMVEDMFECHRRLLRWVLEDERHWDEEPPRLLPAWQLEQRQQVNATAAPAVDDLLHAPVRRHALSTPDAIAVIGSDRTLTYVALDREATQVGHVLRAHGVVPGQLVGIVLDKGWAQVVAAHGILTAGGAYLPTDVNWPDDRLAKVLLHGDVRLVITSSSLRETLRWPDGVTVLALDRDFAEAPVTPLIPVQRTDDLAYVIFTSGSTGEPKGVMVDHRGAVNTMVDANARFGFGAHSRALALSPLHFDLSVFDLFGPARAGGAVVVPDPLPLPPLWADLMVRTGVTFINGVPLLIEMLIDHVEATGDNACLSRLESVVAGGDFVPLTLPGRLAAQNPSTRFFTSGGPAETCVWSIHNRVEEIDPAWVSIPYGLPMTNQRYHILDRRKEPCPTWVVGEMYVESDVGLARGYWADPELTAAKFGRLPGGGRAYATGDLGRYLPDGRIEIVGRNDFQVKIHGVRVELGEVESVLMANEGVRAAVAIASPGASGATIHAFVVCRESRDESDVADELWEACISHLPGAMVPAGITVLPELPTTANGKVDRRRLISLAAESPGALGDISRSPGPATPRGPVEQVICSLVAALLEREHVRPDDDFFILGGNSLTAANLVGLLAEVLGAEVSLRDLFAVRTSAGMTGLVLADSVRRAGVEAMAALLLSDDVASQQRVD